MKKLLITTIALTFTLWCCPAMAQDTDTNQTANSPAQTVIDYGSIETITMYAKGAYEIKAAPVEESDVLDTSLKNTSFEIAGTTEGETWAIIVTDNGFAYIKLEHLSEKTVSEKSYTEQDLYIMAHVLAGEAQTQPDEEQLYVGSVVLNRVNHPSFPDTIKGVVFQKGQYACTWDGNYYREPTERNWANAKKLLEGGSILPSNVIWQSGKKQGKGVYLRTEWHYYCY